MSGITGVTWQAQERLGGVCGCWRDVQATTGVGGLGARWVDRHPAPRAPAGFPLHTAPAPSQGCTYQNPESHDFQQTFQREEGGEDDVEHPQRIFISQGGSVELEQEGERRWARWATGSAEPAVWLFWPRRWDLHLRSLLTPHGAKLPTSEQNKQNRNSFLEPCLRSWDSLAAWACEDFVFPDLSFFFSKTLLTYF